MECAAHAILHESGIDFFAYLSNICYLGSFDNFTESESVLTNKNSNMIRIMKGKVPQTRIFIKTIAFLVF